LPNESSNAYYQASKLLFPSVGYQLNADGGIEIYVSATKPRGVSEEDWLPIKCSAFTQLIVEKNQNVDDAAV
jgi:hypothetical protein